MKAPSLRWQRPVLPGALALRAAWGTLMGCTGLHPGSAVVVGGETISRIRCGLNKSRGQPVDYSTLAQDTVNALVNASLYRQFGEAQQIKLDQELLAARMNQFARASSRLPESDREEISGLYHQVVARSLLVLDVGRRILCARGVSNPPFDQASNAGMRRRMEWKRGVDVEIDPRYNVGTSGAAGGRDGSISTPISRFASTQAVGNSNPSFLATLPHDQVCG